MKWDIEAIFGQIVSVYTRLPLAQKIAIPLLIAASMGLIVFVSRWAGRPDYQVLFSGLEQGDAAAVVERLKESKVGYRLRDSGSTVEVTPPDLVHELRLELAADGVPKGGNVGFELFNENALGRTGFVEKITLVRALQGELERTIQSIDAIKSVRVHITKPERSVFVKRDVLPTASVLVRLSPGKDLDKMQIKGISNLVANSVERLTPENVTILDSKGNLLNVKQEDAELTGVDLTRLEYQRKLEAAYSKRVETMLAEILGPGRAVARVSAELDFAQYEKEEEAYDPAGRVARSERLIEESAGLTAEGGVPGVLSNLTNDPGILTPPDSSKNNNIRKENVSNYEISRAVSRTKSAAGKINRLSVAVLVDGRYVEAAGEASAEGGASAMSKHYEPLSNGMLRKIENLVKQSVGFDSSRGDIVTVENIKFFEADGTLEDALVAAERQEMIFKGLSYFLPALFIVLFLMFVVRPLVRFLVSPSDAEVDLSRLLPAGIQELEAELESERAKLSAFDQTAAPAVDIEELEELLSENSRLVRENPQQAALLIRYWLNDGRV